MIDFGEIFENIKDALSEHKKQTLIVCGIIVFMTLCGLFILLISSMKSEPEVQPEVFKELNLSDPLLVPTDSVESDIYVKSRNTEKKWSEIEAEQYFTKPSTQLIQELSASNNKIKNEILGATP